MTLPSDAEGRRRYVIDNIIPSLDLRPFIGGKFVDSVGNDTLHVIDPTTELPLAEMPSASAEDVKRAVGAAREAFDNGPWHRLHPRQRAAALLRLSDLIEHNLEELALLESTDVGKRISGVRAWDIPNAAEVYRYYSGWADKIVGEVLPDAGGLRLCTYREPVGVCAAIMPWNFPFPCMAWKLGPALAAGCTVVVKSAERAPLSAQYLARLISEAGIPPGVINIVAGEGKVAGAALVEDYRIDKITFTGDVETAKTIIRASAVHLPRLTMELGGKNPNIILADADLDAAVNGAVGAMFSVAGQDCGAGSRTLVHESVVDQFVQGVVDLTSKRRLGDPLSDETEQGPQIDRRHFDRIDSYVKQAVTDGARCVLGGGQAPNGGLFYAPTILADVRVDTKIAQEEVFGPVGAVFSFAELDDAIQLANATSYGLAAAVWTTTPSVAEHFVRELRVGTCWVNCYGAFDTNAPWGGMKQSGIGRELGRDGLDAFLETKTVFRA